MAIKVFLCLDCHRYRTDYRCEGCIEKYGEDVLQTCEYCDTEYMEDENCPSCEAYAEAEFKKHAWMANAVQGWRDQLGPCCGGYQRDVRCSECGRYPHVA